MTKINDLRQEAMKLIDEDLDALTIRSCWKCNGAHIYMKKWTDIVIRCFLCGQVYFKGKDITEK